ncbi:sensor histidine kinase [Actinoplanes sp. GCM10030250]|uniref:sensor histidine kinase n=1 Tax=Actinoplanes sp. GCM10030250 TaxID=3273376 RepID=UPI00360D93FF
MRRAMAALTVAAFLTLLVDVAGESRPARALLPAAAFLFVATLGFRLVSGGGTAPGRPWVRYLYVAVIFSLGFVVFVLSHASVGATLMLVVLVIQTVLLLPMAAVVFVVVALPFFHTGMGLAEGVREGLGLFAVAVFAAVVTKLLMREQQARAELAVAHERLREYAVQVEGLAAVQERNRVARDIHDGLGHALTVVQMQIKAARAAPGRADEMLAKAQDQAEEALRVVRRSVSALREPRVAIPLQDALRALVSAADLPIELNIRGTGRRLDAETEESLFRAAQEGLTNVRKHAGASRIFLVLDFTRPDSVRLEVSDDGAGLAPGNKNGSGNEEGSGGGFGLLGLRERAAHLGGELTFAPAPGGGALLRMEVPG